MKLIVGLGNFPDKYHETRHNAGFIFVDFLAKKYGFPTFRERKDFSGLISEGFFGDEKIFLLKPTTLMNLSGRSVAAVMRFFRLGLSNLVIISDDIDQDFGSIRWREKGSSGGHNGIKNIIEILGSDAFPRLKIGIGNEQKTEIPTENFVLTSFSTLEKEILPDIFSRAEKKFFSHLDLLGYPKI